MDLKKMQKVISDHPLPLQHLAVPANLPLLVMAPHPDDFDAIGVTMRFFQKNGNPLYVAVAGTGVNGVEDSFCTPSTGKTKRQIREQEQRASCRFFGLPDDHLSFLRLEEDENGRVMSSDANSDRIRHLFRSIDPAMVFMPHWNDPNLGHQRTYAMMRQVALAAAYPLAIFLNRDPKTIRMRCHVSMGFDENTAAWKSKLLLFHRSQHQRNLNQRGHGMDERILHVDRKSAADCATNAPYAEIFEIELFRSDRLEDILK
jgi:LmbE family N-acetylglucosaminyl deacetylase